MLLEINNLSIDYGPRRVVENVNFTLKRGEILSIVGESGSGKTTVIRAVMGCLASSGKVSDGKIIYENNDLLLNSAAQWRKLSAKEISMIFQDCGNMINPIRTIGKQFLDYILQHEPSWSRNEARAKAIDMIEAVNLPNPENIMHSYPFELSGGMRQRIGIAMAMFFSPKLLLADEPTSALDVTTQAQIIRQIVDIRNSYNVSVILVTHNLGVASYISNKIMVMKHGKVVEYGDREAIINNPQADYTKKLLQAVPVIGGKPYYE